MHALPYTYINQTRSCLSVWVLSTYPPVNNNTPLKPKNNTFGWIFVALSSLTEARFPPSLKNTFECILFTLSFCWRRHYHFWRRRVCLLRGRGYYSGEELSQQTHLIPLAGNTLSLQDEGPVRGVYKAASQAIRDLDASLCCNAWPGHSCHTHAKLCAQTFLYA